MATPSLNTFRRRPTMCCRSKKAHCTRRFIAWNYAESWIRTGDYRRTIVAPSTTDSRQPARRCWPGKPNTGIAWLPPSDGCWRPHRPAMFSEWLSSLRLRLRAIWKRKQLDRDLREEMAFHLAKRQEKLKSAGLGERRAHGVAQR